MELRMLRYFLAVAEEGNMTKAAQHLHLTQPTLSRQIMQLEEELGVPLLDRKENLALTEQGRLMKQRAQEILALVDKTKKEFTTVLERLTGTIRIGCGEFASSAHLADILAAFQRQHTDVYIDLHMADPDGLCQLLHQEALDLILTPVPAEAASALDVFPLPWQEQLGILLDDEDALLANPALSIADIANRPLIVPSSQLERRILQDWQPEEWHSLPLMGEGNTLYTRRLLGAAAHGLAIAYKPHTAAPPLHWKPLTPPCQVPLCLCWKKDREQSDAIKACIAFIKESVQQPPGET